MSQLLNIHTRIKLCKNNICQLLLVLPHLPFECLMLKTIQNQLKVHEGIKKKHYQDQL